MAQRLLQSAAALLRPAAAVTSSGCRSFATSQSGSPVYLLFGASGGIGSELARRLVAQQGSSVVLAAQQEDKLQGLAQELGGGEVHTVDVRHEEQVQDVVEKVLRKHKRIDGVANLVGNMVLKPAHITSAEEFREAIDLNLLSAFNVVKATVQPMIKSGGGGSIVLTSTAVAHKGTPNHDAIAAAKGGVAGLMLSAAATYAPHQIRVNCVAPGLIKTPMTQSVTKSQQSTHASASMHPVGRIGEAWEVARAIEFLLHPDSSFITGQVLAVDGGLSHAMPSGEDHTL